MYGNLSRRSLSLSAAALFVAFVLSPSLSAQSTPPAFRFSPVADSYVESGVNAGKNFGTAPSLLVRNGISPIVSYQSVQWSYLKFDLSKYTGPIGRATLTLYGSHRGSAADQDSAYGVLDNSWGEYTITWNNKPPLGPFQSATKVGQTPAYYTWDVTPFVRQQLMGAGPTTSPIITLAVVEDPYNYGGTGDVFGSRESSPSVTPYAAPYLVIDSSLP